MSNEIREAVENTLKNNSITMKAKHIAFIEDEWKHDLWQVTFRKGTSEFKTEFKTGIGHRKLRDGAMPWAIKASKNSVAYAEWEKVNVVPVSPSETDVLYCLIADSEASSMSFNDWCSSLGYNNDSISAFNTYRDYCEIGNKLISLFGQKVINELRIALENY